MGNSESDSRNEQVPPGDGIKKGGGGYKESVTAFREACKKLNKCMEAHSDYYHPYLASTKAAEEVEMNFYKRAKVDLFSFLEGECPCKE